MSIMFDLMILRRLLIFVKFVNLLIRYLFLKKIGILIGV